MLDDVQIMSNVESIINWINVDFITLMFGINVLKMRKHEIIWPKLIKIMCWIYNYFLEIWFQSLHKLGIKFGNINRKSLDTISNENSYILLELHPSWTLLPNKCVDTIILIGSNVIYMLQIFAQYTTSMRKYPVFDFNSIKSSLFLLMWCCWLHLQCNPALREVANDKKWQDVSFIIL